MLTLPFLILHMKERAPQSPSSPPKTFPT